MAGSVGARGLTPPPNSLKLSEVSPHETEIISWLGVLLPTLIPAASAFGTVFWLFMLTTKKERQELEENQQRARSVSATVWLQLTNLIAEGRRVAGSVQLRDLDAKARGLCEYCDIATKDVYRYNSITSFNRFAHLKRIAYHYRDAIYMLVDQDFSTAKLHAVSDDVQSRMDQYAEIYL